MAIVKREDPALILPRLASKLRSVWLSRTYPFAHFGKGVSVHYSCDISRAACPYISLGDDVRLGEQVWLYVAATREGEGTKLVLGNGCDVGRRTVISAKNRIVFGSNVLLAPGVLVMDHNHDHGDVTKPIKLQGLTAGGTIEIDDNCWVGFGAVVICGSGHLKIGRNSVIGANAVVTRSFPQASVIAGNPAKLVRTRVTDGGDQ